jgi:hypothetical protein
VDRTANTIVRYFKSDFDEGTHLAGQMHFDDSVETDEKLKTSLAFLIGAGRLDQARNLIQEIESRGEISSDTQEAQAMLDLSLGDFESAISRLVELDSDDLQFYLAQSYLKQGNITSAVPGLVKTIDNCT